MFSRKNLLVTMILVLVVAVLAGCGTAEEAVMALERQIDITMEDALAAQEKAMNALMTGEATWSEAEFSSLVSTLIEQNGGGAFVEEVKAYFDDGNMITLEATLPGGVKAALAGTIDVNDANNIEIDLEAASAMGMAAAGGMLDVVEGAINRALADPTMGVAVDVETTEGGISLGLE